MAVQLLARLATVAAKPSKADQLGGIKSGFSGNLLKDNLRFNITDDIARLSNRLSNIQRQQLPFATALAMTRTAQGLEKAQKKEMRKVFNKPVGYTLKSIAVDPARKNDEPINARVFFREFSGKGVPAYKYLSPNIFGGARGQKGHEKRLSSKLGGTIFTAPASGAPVNAAGNITGGNYTKILAGVQAFSEVGSTMNTTGASRKKRKSKTSYYVISKGGRPTSVRQRSGGSSKPVLNLFSTAPTYKKRYDFYGLGNRYIKQNLPRNFKSAFRTALRTAK